MSTQSTQGRAVEHSTALHCAAAGHHFTGDSVAVLRLNVLGTR